MRTKENLSRSLEHRSASAPCVSGPVTASQPGPDVCSRALADRRRFRARWIISKRLGRRKLVIMGDTLLLLGVPAWMLFGNPRILWGPIAGIFMGIASGAAILFYTVVKHVSPAREFKSATIYLD